MSSDPSGASNMSDVPLVSSDTSNLEDLSEEYVNSLTHRLSLLLLDNILKEVMRGIPKARIKEVEAAKKLIAKHGNNVDEAKIKVRTYEEEVRRKMQQHLKAVENVFPHCLDEAKSKNLLPE